MASWYASEGTTSNVHINHSHAKIEPTDLPLQLLLKSQGPSLPLHKVDQAVQRQAKENPTEEKELSWT